MPINWTTCVVYAWLIMTMTTASLAQSAQVAVRSDESIRQTLEQGDPKQVVQLFTTLGISQDVAEAYEGVGRQPSEEKFAWFELRPINGAKARLLFLPCALSQSGAILLTLNGKKWKIQDTVGFDCHYDDKVSLQMLYLTSRKQFDLIVRHDCESHGTGYLEQHSRVFRIKSAKIQKILDETDLLNDYNPPVAERQTSTFIPTATGVLEETRETVKFTADDEPIPSSLRVERRTFRWCAGLKKFQSSPFRRLR